MKNFFRTIFILISIFSVVGIVFIGVYYIKKNIGSFKKLFNVVSNSVEDLELSNSEVEKVADAITEVAEEIKESVSNDVSVVKSQVNDVAKSINKDKVVRAFEQVKDVVEVIPNMKNENVLFQFNVGAQNKTKKTSTKTSKRKNATAPKGSLNNRQKEVLNFVKENPGTKMSSVSKKFNNVTPRTLRRDFGKLEQMGFLKQQGKTRDAIYKIV